MIDGIVKGFAFIIAAIDGVYGWLPETIAMLVIVIIFNLLARKLLLHLHYRFSNQGKIWHDSFVKAFHKPLTYYVWFFAIVHILDLIAIRLVDFATIENMHTVLAIGAVGALAWFFIRWKKFVIQHMMTKSKNHEIPLDISKLDVIDKVFTLLTLFTTLLIILEITERSMSTLIAFGGIGGLALAFASQEIISNFFAGLMIYATSPFSKGDWIIVPDKNIEGIVEDIGWYMTRIKSMDKRPLYVPNAIFSKAIIINPARMSHRQLKLTIGLRYEDMPVLRTIMNDIKNMLQKHPDIDRNMSIQVHFSSFGSYSLDIVMSAYCTTIQTEGFNIVKDDILFKIAEIINKNGAEMAFPTSNICISESLLGSKTLLKS